jgi:hypothetical protein
MPYNDGQLYEKSIQALLQRKSLLPAFLGNNDAGFIKDGIDYFIEIKNHRALDFGQKKINWSVSEGWHWAEVDEITELYDEFGVLDLIDDKFTPKRYTVPFNTFSPLDRRFDQQNFEQSNIKLDNIEALYEFYARKNCHYIQIEDKGFYILSEDKAKLLNNVPPKPLVKLNAKPTLRLRAKRHHSIPHYDYSFFAVIQIRRYEIVPSNYDLEEKNGRLFPPLVNQDGKDSESTESAE